ncbi:type II secretion system protein [Weissella confusa]|uniref:type II secretion system protein n=1 Tax=Weissella confusa TaxID=1583 RepID=UPI003BF4F5E6
MLWRNRVSCRRLISIDVDADVSKYGGFNDMVKQNKRKGFTLIEVVTTVFIIGLLDYWYCWYYQTLTTFGHLRNVSNKQPWYKLCKHK